MECTIWIPCGCLPFFKKKKLNKIINNNDKTKCEYLPIFDNSIERN
jgi:hypothetical protein